MATLEQQQAKWTVLNQRDRIPAFKPTQPNWGDLAVMDLEPSLTPVFSDHGYRLVKRADFPITHPMRQENGGSIVEVMERVSIGGSHERGHEDYVDQEDKLHYVKGDPSNPEAITVIRPYARLQSPHWSVNWQARMDIMVNIGGGFGYRAARALVPPQAVRGQISNTEQGVRIMHRGAIHRFGDDARDQLEPIYEDGRLFYFHELVVTRGGRYPFSEDAKPELVAAITEAVRGNLVQETQHQDKHLAIYRACLTQGVDLSQMLAAIDR